MSRIPVEAVQEFQNRFLDTMRMTHRTDVLEPLSEGRLDGEICAIIENVAATVAAGIKA